MNRIAGLILLLLVLTGKLCAQKEIEADSTLPTPFKKGIILVGISGNVSSSNFGKSVVTNTAKLGNSYSIDLRLGKFVADKNMAGLQLYTNRVNMVGILESTAEVTSIGPFYRLYLGKHPDFALMFLGSAMWANYISSSIGLVSAAQINQNIEAGGINGSLGIGVTYIMAKRVTFEVMSEYSLFFLGPELHGQKENTQTYDHALNHHLSVFQTIL